MAQLLTAIQEGVPGSLEVFRDWCIDVGMPEHLISGFVHEALLGPEPKVPEERRTGRGPWTVPVKAVRPYVFYDTVDIERHPSPTGYRYAFFRDISDKYEDKTNCMTPCRIRIGDRLHVRRITATGPGIEGGAVSFMLNRRPVLDIPLSELLLRGAVGYPVDVLIADNDDIRLNVTDARVSGATASVPLRIMLHGWLKEPIGL